ncbi:diphosphate--fructose-6-phosphate 1-phosphotransferase [Candidatus Nitrospira nitrificans]|jgi:6-phosphofructokinase|uniref:Pyrophosphate--fructose 6-phosphate 1-phosphotransferase n=1 Tax=Candidatus Nitrospira nitrificans TaxID=1742973 RepID=A0A0S4LIB3_9BACT|nr:diphosphate--fructose-6-phosphate 1-phosphotransferase [Candidatus Nitrospira nitrificans]CUS37253.1 6-phosphofructokinase [Candidatus Nitrospira nitrificans]
MTDQRTTVGILVGGGPAPGINSVINAATIRSILGGADVLGIIDGFKWLMEGGTGQVRPLSIEDVSRIHFRGGSYLGTSRANPTKSTELLDNVLFGLSSLGITRLVTIGGDDTAFSAMKLEERSNGRLQVVHVPKTIDNDLDLPFGIPTFGFQTARHIGVEIVKNLMVDARATTRWYLVVTMGRKAGHLALGIGKAAGATLTIVPEEFRDRPVGLQWVVDLLMGAIIKRLEHGRADGVAVLAEGLIEIIDPRDLGGLEHVERDEHGHLRMSEIDIGDVLRRELTKQLRQLGLAVSLVAKNVGYELRCADPIPYDIEYTRDLGYCAAQYLLDGGTSAMVSIQNGRFTPIPFTQMVDSSTGRTKVRMVDIESQSYQIARQYMIRLTEADVNNQDALGRYAALTGLSPEAFRERFGTVC